MKERAAELRAEGKKGAKKADGLQAVLDTIAKMAPQDRALAECVHMTVIATGPDLSRKTSYGMPAYATADGKVGVFFQDWANSATGTRPRVSRKRPAVGDGDLWPVPYVLVKWSPEVEKKIAELVKAAVS